jgi:hypothetical protein
MQNMAGKMCHNHANIPAVSTCGMCAKPLCEDCILEVSGGHYCSERCAGDGIDKRARSTVLNSANQKSAASTFRAKVVIFLILVGLAYAGYVYWRNSQVKMGKLKEDVPKTLQNADSRRQQQ